MELHCSLSAVFPHFRALCEDPVHSLGHEVQNATRNHASPSSFRVSRDVAKFGIQSKDGSSSFSALWQWQRAPATTEFQAVRLRHMSDRSCASLGAWQRRNIFSCLTTITSFAWQLSLLISLQECRSAQGRNRRPCSTCWPHVPLPSGELHEEQPHAHCVSKGPLRCSLQARHPTMHCTRSSGLAFGRCTTSTFPSCCD